MAQLRSCYFCGTTGALSEYATLPKEFRTDDEQPRRVVLCSRCHTKLTNVLTPIVDQLRDGADGGTPDPSGPPEGRSDSTTVEPADAPSGDPSTTQPELTFSGSAAHDDAAGTDSRGTATAEAEPAQSDDADAVENEGENEDAETHGTPDDIEADGSSPETVDDPEPPGGVGESGPSEHSNSPDAEESDVSARLERVYDQLLRFLRNREFPIPRSEAELIAQSAYDLSAAEATEVIQLTIDRDVLEERGGELHRR